MNKNSQSYERLEKVIEWSGLTRHAFALSIGLNRSENIYRIIRDKDCLSTKLIMKIINTYPQINRNWLTYGDGEMENSDEIMKSVIIPFFETSQTKLHFNLNIPIFEDANIAIRVTDNAMFPTIPMGSIVIAKEQSKELIIYGRPYLIKINDISIVRILRKPSFDSNLLILEASNAKDYDNITIEKKDIETIYSVCGIINNFL